jgi:hypothetical protein
MQESQPFDDTVVEVDEFCFGEAVDVNSHCRSPSVVLMRPNV